MNPTAALASVFDEYAFARRKASRMAIVTWLLAAGLACTLAGCGGMPVTDAGDGGSDVVIGDGTPGDGTPGDGGGGDAGSATLTVTVLEPTTGAMTAPLAGVLVAFDRPDGMREEQMTDSMGRVMFTNIAWGTATGALTFYKTDYLIHSRVGLTAADSTYRAVLGRSPPRRATLTGMLSGLMAPTNTVLLSASIPNGGYRGTQTAPYMFEIAEGQAFALTGVEFTTGTDMVSSRGYSSRLLRWFRLDRAAQTGNGMFDIDVSMAMPMTPTTARSTLVLPAAPSMLRDMSRGNVTVVGGESLMVWNLGYSYRGDVSMDGSTYDTMTEYVRPAAMAGRVFTRYTISRGEASTSITRADYPMDNARIDGFYDSPAVTAPAGATPYVLGQPVTVSNTPRGARLFVNFVENDRVLWSVSGPIGSGMITVPALPSGTPAAALGRFSIRGYAGFCEPGMTDDDPCARLAFSTRWLVMRP